ncbi:translation protein [Daldinia sp. FL1419]|nr:translation protein [Daldinia sp. FL1419]
MSACRDEHDHDHGSHGHHHDEHDHSDDITPALQHSLYQHIMFDSITTLNETQHGSGKDIVKKTWAERNELEPELVSDADEQVIINVPFTGQVKLHAILLRAPADASAPCTLKVFVNREDVDFDVATDLQPTQTFELSQVNDVQEIPVRRALFGNVRRLALFFEDNFGEDNTRISYLGFRGDWMPVGRAPTNILYEAAPNPSDHPMRGVAEQGRARGPFATSSPASPSLFWPLPFSTADIKITHFRICPCRPTMASRLPARWAATLSKSCLLGNTRVLVTERHTLLPRTAKRGVKYGWSTANPRTKPTRFNQQTAGLPAPTTGPAAALERKKMSTPLRTGILATKTGVSAMYSSNGKRTPCTILQMDQVQVVAVKTRAKNGYWALQIGCGQKEPDNVTAPQLGYFEAKGIAPKRHLSEFKVRGEEGLLPVGVQLQPDWFKVGQFVDARSDSRGMGFAGGMKRHGFAGQEASHGNSKNHRTIGTSGPSQGGGSRVHPGKKMPGRMGGERVTIQNLRVLKVDNETGIVVVNGHVAGPKGCIVMLADAVKKPPPAETFIEKARRLLLERNPDHEAQLQAARETHLNLKEMRKAGRIGDAVAMAAAL